MESLLPFLCLLLCFFPLIVLLLLLLIVLLPEEEPLPELPALPDELFCAKTAVPERRDSPKVATMIFFILIISLLN